MLKLSVFLSTILLSFSVLASPALEEKQEFCNTVGSNVAAASEARNVLKMPIEEFQSRVMEYFMGLQFQLQAGILTELQVLMLMEAVLEGWEGTTTPEKAFEACMNKTEI